MHLGQLSTNDSYSLWVSEHDGENRIELLSVVFKFPLREGGQVLAKIDVDTLKGSLPRLKFHDFTKPYLGSRKRLRHQNSFVGVIFDA